MKLFTVGPVEMEKYIRDKGGEPIPYFRTAEFSKIMLEIQEHFLRLLDAPTGAKLVPLTASGTGAMEAAVLNVLTAEDKCLIIDGGSFGHRFTEICSMHGIPFECLKLRFGERLKEKHLEAFDNKEITALLVNIDETSTAQLYDYRMLGKFCKRNNAIYIIDSISSFLADPFSMRQGNVDVFITSSQKALALPPGLSFIVLSPKIIKERIGKSRKRTYYFDFENYLLNMERGQTPFTPAVGILLQLQLRLEEICKNGIESEIAKHRERAETFRKLCVETGIKLPEYPMSNAVTAILFPKGNATNVFHIMKNTYGMMLTPNGGELRDIVLRVGHMGDLKLTDYQELIKDLDYAIKDSLTSELFNP